MSEGLIARQQAEFEILKSIYDRDVEADDSKDFLDVSINLTPLYDSKNADIHVSIVMQIICDEFYPERVPIIILSKSKGLSRIQIQTLQVTLEELANKLRGEVMIFELAHCVQEFLHQNNKPGTKSFYDEMLLRNQQLELARSRYEADFNSKVRRDLKERVSLKEAHAQSSSGDDNDDSLSEEEANSETVTRRVRFTDQEDDIRKSIGSGDLDCDHRCCRYIQFASKVLRGRCLEHEDHCVLYYAVDNSNGDPLLIREYILKPQEKQTSKELLSHVLSQLNSIEQELQYLKKFRNDNLVAYVNFKYIVEKDYLLTYLVQEFICNVNLSSYRKSDVSLDVSFIRHIVIGILNALAYLHHHNIIHKSLTSSSVYLSKIGVVKVGNYSLTRRLEDLQQSCRLSQTSSSKSKVSRAIDILHLGALVLDLLGVAADPLNPPKLPDSTSSHLKDFLDMCFLPEDGRWTARQLQDHYFVKTSVPYEVWSKPITNGEEKQAECKENEEVEEDELFYHLKIPNDLKFQSRLSSEFKVLKYLGSGSFGKVLKAKNRLDGGVYAIKAIELNPRNKMLNRKMIREVKLLSKLNHENVVRYYNSWIETTNVDDTSSVTQVTSTPLQSLTQMQSLKAFETHSGLSLRSGPLVDEVDGDYNDEDDDDEDEDDVSSNSSALRSRDLKVENSESIVFEQSPEEGADSAVFTETSEQPIETVKQIRSLYIQMEFCEKSTLRIAIDNGLSEDSQRCWRLVREVIEGLEYIHQQDMIHRDLKPVNIFLDSSDHVKIGDFGLATTSVLTRNNVIFSTAVSGADSEGSSHIQTEDSHTGGVGTSFYVAPELRKQYGKAHYNKKVDIYSLGIILFEMAHPPFNTHMERCKSLSNLRLPEIVIPPDMNEKFPRQMNLVQLLLNHDPCKRPTCSEILTGDLLPPPQVENSRLQDFIRHTLSNSQSKAYKYLISSCFDQNISLEEDLTYHSDSFSSERLLTLQDSVRDTVEAIVRRHGAKYMSTPLLLPKTDVYVDGVACARLMTHSGSVVLLPYDLRVPFARLVARKDITQVRRYCVDRVYRERKTHGYHPREAYECAFDIITSSPSVVAADAEMLCVLNEVVDELVALKTQNCTLRINHTCILQSMLLALGVDKMYSSVFQVLQEAREGKYSRTRLESCLQSLSLSDQTVVTLAVLCHKEDSLTKVFQEIMPVVKRKEEAHTIAKKAFEQLKMVMSHAEALGVKVPLKVSPGVVHTSNICSGIMFDLICPVQHKRKKDGYEILASGCRYDQLISKFRRMFELTRVIPKDAEQNAVGLSVALDKIVNILRDCDEPAAAVTAIVCSLGQDSMARAKAEVLRSLWASNVSSHLLDNVDTLEDLEDYGRENNVSHLIWLKECEPGALRVRSWERDRERYIEKKMPIAEITDFIIRSCKVAGDLEITGATRTLHLNPSGSQVCNVHIMVEDKLAANARRRHEAQIKSHMTSFLTNFSSKPTIEILGLFLELKVVKVIAANLEFGDDNSDYGANVQIIVEKYPRLKKYLLKICDKINSLYVEKANLVVILYSLPDDKFKQII